MQLFGTKWQWDKLKILPRDRTGGDSQNSGQDRPGQPKSGTGRGKKRDRAEKDILKQKNDVLKQKTMFYNRKGCSKTGKWCSKTGKLVFLIHFVLRCPGTEEFGKCKAWNSIIRKSFFRLSLWKLKLKCTSTHSILRVNEFRWVPFQRNPQHSGHFSSILSKKYTHHLEWLE